MVSRLNSSNFSTCAQCPHCPNTCNCTRGICLSATSAPSRGLTRSSRPHQHQPPGAVGMIEGQAHRRAAAQRVTDQGGTFDAEMVEQGEYGVGAVTVVLLVFGVFVGQPVPGLVDRDDVEMVGQHRDVAAEVRPARRSRPAAVKQHNGGAAAGLVVVQPHVALPGADICEA